MHIYSKNIYIREINSNFRNFEQLKKDSSSGTPCVSEHILCNSRLQCLERNILIYDDKTPSVVFEMKKQVDSFREKLEVHQQAGGFIISEFLAF